MVIMPEMLESIKSFFSDLLFSKSSSMSYVTLYKKLTYWKDNRVFPNGFDLPEVISLPDDFWKHVSELHKLTLADGHERAISVFWGDGELILSSVVRGTTSSVKSGGEVKINYVPTSRREYFNKEVYVDEKLYSRREVYYKSMPKKIELKYLFNMHTHPAHLNTMSGENYYSFFSRQDLDSQLSANAVISGLITDKLWLIFRTTQSPTVLNNFDESEISVESLNERAKFGVYCGEFGRKLIRLT
jgi:hypothetical protein